MRPKNAASLFGVRCAHLFAIFVSCCFFSFYRARRCYVSRRPADGAPTPSSVPLTRLAQALVLDTRRPRTVVPNPPKQGQDQREITSEHDYCSATSPIFPQAIHTPASLQYLLADDQRGGHAIGPNRMHTYKHAS